MLGKFYTRNNYGDSKNRLFRVMSVTLTHVYVQNVRLGYSYNVPINSFEMGFTMHVSSIDAV